MKNMKNGFVMKGEVEYHAEFDNGKLIKKFK